MVEMFYFVSFLNFKILFFIALIVHLLMLKLEVVRDLLVGSSQSEDRLDALINSAIYLKVFLVLLFLTFILILAFAGNT